MRWGPTAVACGVAAALAGCGSSTQTVTSYRTDAERACATAFDATRGLPALAQSRHLDEAEIQTRGETIGKAFQSRLAGLRPPTGLADGHKQLLADLDAAVTVASSSNGLIEHDRKLEADYGQLGLDSCESDVAQGLRQVLKVGTGPKP